jgi:hypothetical protein
MRVLFRNPVAVSLDWRKAKADLVQDRQTRRRPRRIGSTRAGDDSVSIVSSLASHHANAVAFSVSAFDDR